MSTTSSILDSISLIPKIYLHQHIYTRFYFWKIYVLALRDLHISYYLLWIHPVMGIIISILNHLIQNGKSIWSALISSFKPHTRSYETPLTLTTWCFSSIWFQNINRVWIVFFTKNHKSIHSLNNLQS